MARSADTQRARGAVELPLAALVEDLSIYPRHAVDSHHVAGLADALRAGNQLPPLVIEQGSNRIVDGVHRSRALRKVLGEQGTTSVIPCEYASEADLLLDAIRLNSAHGRRLDRMDQARSVLLAQAAGASVQAISVVLHMPEKRVQQLSVRVAYPAKNGGSSQIPIVLKRPAAHFSGQTMSKAQEAAHVSMPGTSLLLTARQLRLAAQTGLINEADLPLRREIEGLAEALREWFAAHPMPQERAA